MADEQLELLYEMSRALGKRSRTYTTLQRYRSGRCPVPPSIVRAQVTQAYQMLMAFAQTNYGRLIVKAAKSRLEVGGVRTGNSDMDRAVWSIWQGNRMDAMSRRAHDTILTHGRAFAIVWPSDDPDVLIPTITLENPGTVIVKYAEGQPFVREAALRQWTEKEIPYATLYTREAVYKYRGPRGSTGGPETRWEPRLVMRGDEPEEWPFENPAGDVLPVVEISSNRELDDTCFGHAEGDFESCVTLMDRINVLEFLRLVIAFTAGFPIRAVIGDRILRDDNGRPIAPFRLAADVIAQFEDPETRIVEIAATDLKTFGDAIDHDVETLAGITQTPSYFLRSIPIQNVSADAIRASDAPLNARVDDHKPEIAEGWEDMLRVAALMLPEAVEVPNGAEVRWLNRELRSLSERSDAATKLNGILPWQAIVEICFDATQDQITRWETMRASDGLGGLLNDPSDDGDGGL